jgi:hypothetical protein
LGDLRWGAELLCPAQQHFLFGLGEMFGVTGALGGVFGEVVGVVGDRCL